MPWFNGPEKDGHIALIGGPYATQDEAIANKAADDAFVEQCGVVRYDPWWIWFSVEIHDSAKAVTLRQRLTAHEFVAPSSVRHG